MLTEHGVFPHEVLNLPLREKLIMKALIDKQAKENKRMNHGRH
jgi:hypothetical protein